MPVAGADRLSLPGHIAVKDLIALGRFLHPAGGRSVARRGAAQPDLRRQRGDAVRPRAPAARGASRSMRALRERAAADPALPDIAGAARGMGRARRPSSRCSSSTPACSAATACARKMIARLGHEAGDILDEFLNFCLAEERTGLPGLEAFLATLESAGPEIKREMDQGRDEVRIMTVHAAKGLEAPVVFLVDGGAAPFSDSASAAADAVRDRSTLDWPGTGYLWRSGADVANGFSREAAGRAKERADDEYRRLLYVGMTRAEDRLIVCGYHGKRAPNPATWHAIVSRALLGAPETVELPHPVTGEPVHRFRIDAGAGRRPPRRRQDAGDRRALPRRCLAVRPLPPDDDLPRPLSPSGASIADRGCQRAGRLGPLAGARRRRRAGLRHRSAAWSCTSCCRCCPDLPPEERAGGGRALSRARGRRLAAGGARRGAGARSRRSSTHAGFAPIFAPGSRAEVAVMGELTVRGRQRQVTGKIDRLAVTRRRGADRRLQDQPAGARLARRRCRRPMSCSWRSTARCCSRSIPAGRSSAALLFTEAPRLIALPAAGDGCRACPTHAGVTQDLLERSAAHTTTYQRELEFRKDALHGHRQGRQQQLPDRRARRRRAGRRRFLGRMVRSLQDDRSVARGDLDRDWPAR